MLRKKVSKLIYGQKTRKLRKEETQIVIDKCTVIEGVPFSQIIASKNVVTLTLLFYAPLRKKYCQL